MTQALRRKLTTILSADVAGYSRLIDEDEVATVETLMAYRGAIGGFVERHQGRVVSTAGDGLLADSDSVVEAVTCAAEIQRELTARNAEVAEARRMAFRIGINLGDVIVEDGDIYGEGVNVAARLQSLAAPGGICISGTVFDQVRNKLSLGYDFLGPQAVKNIAQPIPTYRVLLGGDAAAAKPRAASDEFTAEAHDDGRRIRAFRRRASRFAVILSLLLVINLITDASDLWVVWPALALGTVLALSALRTFGGERFGWRGPPDRTHGVRLGQMEGDVFVTEDTRTVGRIDGNTTVARGVSLKLLGQIAGDLTIEPGAVVSVIGHIAGDVLNQGDTLRHIGHLGGTEKRVAPSESGASRGPGEGAA